MRRGRIFIYLALILIAALVVAYLFLQPMLGGQAGATPTPATVEILIAGQEISQGETITEEKLGTMLIPENQRSAVTYLKAQIGDVVGKVARYPLDPGVPLTQSLIADSRDDLAATGPQWLTRIPAGKTAIAIPISRLTSAAYGVADGSRVNVISCMLFTDVDPSFQTSLPNHTAVLTGTGSLPEQLPVWSMGVASGGVASAQGRLELDPSIQQLFYIVGSEPQRSRLSCQMVLQDILVLKMGDFPLEDENQAAADPAVDPAAQPQPVEQQPAHATMRPDIITLVVDPQDAVSLTYMIYSGANLTLTLRGADDSSRIETEAATLQFILSQYNLPVPAKLPYATQPRIDEILPPFMPNDIVVVPAQ